MGSPHTIIRFYDHRPSNHLDKLHTSMKIIYHMVTGRRNSGFLIKLLHTGFAFDPWHITLLKSTGNVKSSSQLCILFQPVLVVGFQPVDRTIFKDQKCHTPVNFIIVFQVAYLIIFCQVLFQILAQFIIWLIADSQNIHAIFL